MKDAWGRQIDREDSERVSWAFELRILLLDAERNPLILPRGAGVPVDLTPLKQDDLIIGYLGLLPRPRAYDPPQSQFIQQQRLALTLIAAMALLISALIALPLAGRLVRPIKTLAAAAQRLSAGDYQVRVPVLASHELAQLAQDFNALALTLEKNEQDRRQWVADISHELRTPLAVLRGEISVAGWRQVDHPCRSSFPTCRGAPSWASGRRPLPAVPVRSGHLKFPQAQNESDSCSA